MSGAAWLSVRDLSLERGPRRLFERLAFELDVGSALLVRGPNGSGKSSLLRALLGLTPVSSGEIRFGEQRFAPGSGRLCPAVLYQGPAPGLKSELSALENLALAAALDGSDSRDAALIGALQQVGIGREHRLPTRRLSQGQKQRVTLARLALANRRRLWLLDEPSAALDSDGAALLDRLLAGHLAGGGGAIVATHLPLLAAHDTRSLTLG